MIKGNARDLILDHAERLFAERGVDSVSLRAINAAAGVSPGVLHYHFGNREALITALVERRMAPIMQRRQAMLAPLAEQLKPEVCDIIDALIEPLAEFVLNGGDAGQRYIQLIARLHADKSPLLEQVNRRFNPDSRGNFPELLQRACPQLSKQAITWRLVAANNCLMQTLSELPPNMRHWVSAHLGEQQAAPIIAELSQFISGGFQAASGCHD